MLGLCLVISPAAWADTGDTGLDAYDTSECVYENPDADPPIIALSELYTLLGQIPAYAANPTLLFDGYWTNWYNDSIQVGLAKLAVMRGILETYSLHSTYLDGALSGNDDGTTTCDEDLAERFRSYDGSCNDLDDPLMGAAGTRFARNVPLADAWPDEDDLLVPNPRTVSRALLHRDDDGFQEMPFLNNLGVAWIQFQTHDWFSHGDSSTTTVLSVPLDDDDPLRDEHGITALAIPATAPDPTRIGDEDGVLPPTFANEVTHWWDGSQIYGSDEETTDRLRAFEGGKLRVDEDGLLPTSDEGFSDTGFVRNWWVGLGMMHTLFALEHNAIAEMLADEYPEMDDDELFHTARLVNVAAIARIHTLEWTPAILPNKVLDVAMNANWYGLNEYISPPLTDTNDDPVLFGVVGAGRDLLGAEYALTEEFVSVYRMHPLLPDAYGVYSAEDGEEEGSFETADSRDDEARELIEEYGMPDLLHSFGLASAGALTLQNYPSFLTDLEVPGGYVFDMGTVDVLRDRERGIPRYNDVRPPISDFSDLTDDDDLSDALDEVYGGDVEMLDLMVGTFAEATRPSCYGFGETLFQVFTLLATRRLQADRFFTDLYTEEVYTEAGMDWIESSTLKDVLIRHYPELEETGLATAYNAFHPWEPIAAEPDEDDCADWDEDDWWSWWSAWWSAWSAWWSD